MLRLTFLLLWSPLVALAAPPSKEAPLDLSVPPDEHALRDLIPGWEPVRALTEDEMAWEDSPHIMTLGMAHIIGDRSIVPIIPTTWVRHWPEPDDVVATGVPRGWWWKPKDPELFGGWLVMWKGGKFHGFYDVVTEPLRTVDYARVPTVPAMQHLYRVLRDREAKRRGVDPAVLDREAEALEHHRRIPSAREQLFRLVKELSARDELEEAAERLGWMLGEDPGSPRQHLRMHHVLASIHDERGDVEAAIEHYRRTLEMLPHVERPGDVERLVTKRLAVMETRRGWSPARRLVHRAKSSLGVQALDRAKAYFEAALAAAGEGDDEARWLAHGNLAVIASYQNRHADARAAAKRARALPTVPGHGKLPEAIEMLARDPD